MKLIAVSGGPDSMYLLNLYKKNKNIVVACVNYNVRHDSTVDENIVRKFCEENNIKLEVLSIPKDYLYEGNFQTEARKIRYKFFKEIYEKYNCKSLLMAHHKDDFIETALMQQRSNRQVEYYGIKEKNFIMEMNIERPLLHKMHKRDIEKFLHEHRIQYAIDSSNSQPIYERNKIRLELDKMVPSEKREIYDWFIMSNKVLNKKTKKVHSLYKFWEKQNFDLHFFNLQRFKTELVYKFVHSNFDDVELSKEKIDSIIQFFQGKEGNKYFKLSDKKYIYKKSNSISPHIGPLSDDKIL